MTYETFAAIAFFAGTFLAARADDSPPTLGGQLVAAAILGVFAAGVVALLRDALTAAGLA